MNLRLSLARWARWLPGVAFLVCLAAGASASDLKVEGRLIWGTNDEKSPDPKHKPVDGDTLSNLRKIYQWKHYFEVNRQVLVVSSRNTNTLVMSKDCSVEIAELEGPRITAQLIGKGKRLNKITTNLSPGQSFAIAGEDKNATAYFVIITDLEETHTPAKQTAPAKKEATPKK